GVDQPDLAVAGIGVGFRDGRFAGADRLHLGAGQGDAGLDRDLDRIVEARLAVLSDDLDLALVLVSHSVCQLWRCFSKSRISVNSCCSGVIFGAAGGGGSVRFSVFIARTTRNSAIAMIAKLMHKVRKLPQARTAPCFLASARLPAFTAFDSGVK